ncbi:MAG: hypothetical protein M3O09_08270 [Acidobacteriota bacterium]|nr:hypothetical protein [Acidobacteriota bacterium]
MKLALRRRASLHLVLLALISSLLAGCGGGGASTTPPPNPAPTVTLTSSASTITAGQSATLTWTSTNATTASIDNSIGSVATAGTVSVSPTQTTTYIISVSGAGGTATARTTITVQPVNVAPTVTLSASPATISAGQSSTLTWSSTSATTASIDNGIGSVATSGSISVSPAQTTSYTITVTGTGGSAHAQATVTVQPVSTPPTVTMSANPTTITSGQSSTLTVSATNAAGVVITDNVDSTTYTLTATGGTQSVHPTQTTTYTATATGSGGQTATANVTITVGTRNINNSINHVILMLQENRSFDSYFGMLNPYRVTNRRTVSGDGNTYNVDGIDDKLTTISNQDDENDPPFPLFKLKSTCIDDDSSAWLQSFGDVDRYNFSTTRPILMDGFVHTAENFAKNNGFGGGGTYTDLTGQRAMGYYDQDFLNYYYDMASNFAMSDRWFSPVASESTPNRIATMTGGTTQGLAYDVGRDNLPQLTITTIFEELQNAGVSWKIYYSTTEDQCLVTPGSPCTAPPDKFPATSFSIFTYSVGKPFLYKKNITRPTCTGTTQDSGTAVGDPANAFCIDINHIAPLTQYYTDLQSATLPSFSYIEAGYSHNDEHPGSGQSVLQGQNQVANVINSFMNSPSWSDSVFFFGYDEGGGPYDHVPPVPGKSNKFTNTAALGATPPDIAGITVQPDQYFPCAPATPGTPTLHCDLRARDPGTQLSDSAAQFGFAAQLGFRVPNFIVSPFSRAHYVSHTPMDHTAIIKLVESRFIGPSAHLTARDNVQPDLSEFFDFTNVPWSTPPVPVTPIVPGSPADTCTPDNMGP